MELIDPKNSKNRLEVMSKVELVERLTLIEDEILRVVRENYELRAQKITDAQLQLAVSEQLASLKQEIYGSKSERYKKPANKGDGDEKKAPPKPRVKKPSERYPNIPVREELVTMDPPPACGCCGEQMKESGMTEDAEQLTVIPKKYEIILQKRVKYRCNCQGAIVTALSPARIVDGATYSDEMIQDVVISKYCDLLPINRYAKMAARAGLNGLPTHSLIEVTHQYADFVSEVYRKIKKGILCARVLHADETPHKMLEGSEKKNWYLWGFSTDTLCYLECRDTRSGDVASDILSQAECEFLVSDVYAGYGKAVRIANDQRAKKQKHLIKNVNCNAHARRYFYKVYPKYTESTFYLDEYHEIYQLNSKSKGQAPPEILLLREQMRSRFEKMRSRAIEDLGRYPNKNKFTKGLRYFLDNYQTLTYFLNHPELPIDNNSQERLLRSHVVGRKTWYGTHSKDGALTAAILFSIIETCKLCEVNPNNYLTKLTSDLLAGKPAYTPAEYKTTLQIQ
jgi:transposase